MVRWFLTNFRKGIPLTVSMCHGSWNGGYVHPPYLHSPQLKMRTIIKANPQKTTSELSRTKLKKLGFTLPVYPQLLKKKQIRFHCCQNTRLWRWLIKHTKPNPSENYQRKTSIFLQKKLHKFSKISSYLVHFRKIKGRIFCGFPLICIIWAFYAL